MLRYAALRVGKGLTQKKNIVNLYSTAPQQKPKPIYCIHCWLLVLPHPKLNPCPCGFV